jgi:hypothetical protein
MGQVARRQLVNLLAALLVAAVLGTLAFGLPALDRSLDPERPVRSGVAYAVGAGVVVLPPRGATVDVTATRPGDGAGSVLFRVGAVRYSIQVQPFDGTLAAAAARLRDRITGTTGYQVTGGGLAVATATGLTGIQGGYTGQGRDGRFTVFVTRGRTIEVTVSGTGPDLRRALPAIEASTRTIRYRDPK